MYLKLVLVLWKKKFHNLYLQLVSKLCSGLVPIFHSKLTSKLYSKLYLFQRLFQIRIWESKNEIWTKLKNHWEGKSAALSHHFLKGEKRHNNSCWIALDAIQRSLKPRFSALFQILRFHLIHCLWKICLSLLCV